MDAHGLALYVIASLALIVMRGGGARLSLPALVWQGILSNVTNPKIVLLFFAFLPQFVDRASVHPTRDLVFLGVLYAALALPVKVGVGLGAGGRSERILRSGPTFRWIQRAARRY